MAQIIDIVFPAETQEGTESIVAKWLKKPGDAVALHEPVVEISTDKVSMEIASPGAGIISEIIKDENQEIKPGDVLGRIEAGATAGAAAPSVKEKSPHRAASSTAADASGELSPAVKKLLKEHGLNPADVVGTGRGGRITPDDVISHTQKKSSAPASSIPSHSITHTPMRRMVAKHMTDSLLRVAPHVTSVFEADLTRIIADREEKKGGFEKKGVKLSFTPYFVKAAAAALKAVPEVNSRWHDDRLELFDEINIGVGTALETGGLIVPVLKRADKLDLFQTAETLHDLISRARENKLAQDEVQGGTFTISNHGVSGSLVATPIIINQPQSAILGIGKLEKRVKVIDEGGKDSIVIRPTVFVTLTIDHRVLDGFQANSFLTHFVRSLEEN